MGSDDQGTKSRGFRSQADKHGTGRRNSARRKGSLTQAGKIVPKLPIMIFKIVVCKVLMKIGSPRGHSAMSGNIFGYHNLGGQCYPCLTGRG